jgi:type IV pilus assembly protein PilM
MLNAKSFLAVDFGAGSLKLAEFEVNEAGGLRLKQFVIKSLGLEASQEAKREAVILKALQEVISEKGIKAKDVNVCAPGFHVFSKFVKLPPVEAGKVTQIIQYEAQQNVPFPLAEVVWDYQILSTAAGGELEVLLVAIKADIVEGLFRVAETTGLRLQLCDVSPAALCNAFRYNYGELEDCTMLLDIGAKTSNLLFFEKGKVFSRSINLGANSITQDFANESKLKFDVADKIKIDEGFVSLGGAYEEPENPHQAAISKIARQFMTRLHIQVNQTLQFYRGQQGGSAPQRLFLSGGASIMPYTAQFFAEKLNVPVEYFNPLRSVQIDPSVNLEELARVAHSLGEVVGLGLRNLAHCPVELNLMPESTLRWQSFNQKKPYFIATLASLVLMAFAVGYLFDKQAGVKREQAARLDKEIEPRMRKEKQFKTAYHEDWQSATNDLARVTTWMENRYYWADVLKEVRRVLIHVEELTKKKLYGNDGGIWVEQFDATIPPVATDPTGAPTSAPGAPLDVPGAVPGAPPPAPEEPNLEEMRLLQQRLGGMPPGFAEQAAGATPLAGSGMSMAGVTEISAVTLLFRAVSLTQVAASANTDIAYALLDELKASPLCEPNGTQFSTMIIPDDATGTFTFGVIMTLKQPLKL